MDIPIEQARNLGPKTAQEISSIGITTLEQLQEIGWENACIQIATAYPHRCNLNMFTAIIGAIENEDWRKISPSLKQQAKNLCNELKGK